MWEKIESKEYQKCQDNNNSIYSNDIYIIWKNHGNDSWVKSLKDVVFCSGMYRSMNQGIFFAFEPFGIRYFHDFTKYWGQLLFNMFVNENSKQLKNLIEVT